MLQNYSKGKKKAYTGKVAGWCDAQTVKEFRDHCTALGLTVSEGVRILVENELKQAKSSSPEGEKLERAAVPNPKIRTKPSGRKGDLNEFTITRPNGSKVAPCPVCESFYSTSTFRGRHTNAHGFSDNRAFLTDPRYSAKVQEMIADEKKRLNLE